MAFKLNSVVSFDPIYRFSKEEISERMEEVRVTVMRQMRENMDNYVWTHIKDVEDLENIQRNKNISNCRLRCK